MIGIEKFFESESIIAGFTNREGGFSKGNYAEFNLGPHTGENADTVLKNRKLLADSLNIRENKLVFMNQIHSDIIKIIDNKNFISAGINNNAGDCDAIISLIPGFLLCVMTADCMPVILFDEKTKIYAAIHAGWKGAVSNIIFKVINKIVSIDSCVSPENIKIFIGPYICGKCYEVSSDFISNIEPEKKNTLIQRDNKFYFDMKKYIEYDFQKSGVLKKNINDCNICSLEHSGKYYSYRKNNITGRQVTFISIKK